MISLQNVSRYYVAGERSVHALDGVSLMSVLVVGSIALDTVKTPVEEHADQLGGSASYAAVGASFFSPVKLVGVVGDDFPQSEFEFWKSRNIDATGVQQIAGKTFRWSGEYAWDLNTRETKSVALNVFENFKPELPENFRETKFVLLANIAPSLQLHVQKNPRCAGQQPDRSGDVSADYRVGQDSRLGTAPRPRGRWLGGAEL